MKNAIKWVLVLPACVVTYIVAYWINKLILGSWIGHFFDTWEWWNYIHVLFYECVAQIMGVFAAITVASMIAPSHKTITMRVIAALFMLLGASSLTIMLTIGTTEKYPSIQIISAIVTILTAIVVVVTKDKDLEE